MSAETTTPKSDDWYETTWGELVELKYGKGLREYKDSIDEFPVYGTNGAVGWCDKPLCEFPSIIIGRKGAYRGVHYSDRPFYVIDTAYFVVPKKKINLKWAYYHLLTQDINGLDSGSAIPSTRREDFYHLPVRVPPLKVQNEIVNNLDSFNEKIELNRQINQTLEAMAQTIFKSWFVDFEPVKAKIAAIEAGEDTEGITRAAMSAISGKTDEELDQLQAEQPEYYMQLKTSAELFPCSMQDSELGEVPEGWEVKPLGEYLVVKRGGSPRPIKDFIVPNGLPWVKIADATAQPSPFLFKTKEFIKSEGLKKTVLLKKGSLILSNSATPGLPKFLELDACIHDGWLHFPKKKLYSNVYLYHLFLELRTKLVAQGNGSVFTNLKTDILRNQVVVAPAKEIIDKFDDSIVLIFEKLKESCEEINILSQLRDTLLPKLLSGKISVGAAEFAEE